MWFFAPATMDALPIEHSESNSNSSDSDEEGNIDDKPLVNMTPHDLHILDAQCEDRTGKVSPKFVVIPPCGFAPRMVSNDQTIEGWLCSKRVVIFSPAKFTAVSDIESFEKYATKDQPIVVARYVAEFLSKEGYEWDGGIYTPDCGPKSAIRDDHGKLIGVARLEGPWKPAVIGSQKPTALNSTVTFLSKVVFSILFIYIGYCLSSMI